MNKAISFGLALALLPPVAAAQDGAIRLDSPRPAWEYPSCAKGYAGDAGVHSGTLTSGGVERSYLLYVPKAYDGSQDWPVIFDFHGSGSTPQAEMAVSGLNTLAESDHFLLVNPTGALLESRNINTWNIPHDPDGVDDVQFARDLLAKLQGELCVNSRAVYATGFSGGARMSSELACRASDIFAAVAPVAGLRFPEDAEGDCMTGRPMPIVTFHSVDDPVNLYDVQPGGTPPPYWSYGIEEALERWRRKDDCGVTPFVTPMTDDWQIVAYQGCAGHLELTLYRTLHNGHSWPGSSYDFPKAIGTPHPALSASAVAVSFFKAYRLPGQ